MDEEDDDDDGVFVLKTPSSFCQPPKNYDQKETIDKSIVEEMLVLRASNLLFEDDLDHVDTIFASFESNQNEPLRYMFNGSISALVIALGLGFYLYLGGIAFLLVSVFYAYRTTDYFWRKNRRLRSLKRLMATIQSNFSLINRLVKFLYDSEILLKTKARSSQNAQAFVLNLKSDYVKIQTEIITVLSDATLTLLNSVSLVEYIDNSACYDCRFVSELKNCANVSQLYNVYMLLQSQFLTRLTLSLIPNLLTDRNSNKYIDKVIAKASVNFERLEATLNTKLKFALLNGVSHEKDKSSRLPEKPRSADVSSETMLRNIHDLSNSLQYCLLKARELENNLTSGDTTDPEQDLTAIDTELNSCRSHISDIFIMNKKLCGKAKGAEFSKQDKLEISDADGVTFTELGLPDLDPIVDDDIFEAFIDGSENEEDRKCSWDEDEVDPLVKKKQREMLGELKTRLKLQADDWKKREHKVFERKGLHLEVSDSEESRPETTLGEAIFATGFNQNDLQKIIQEQNEKMLDKNHEQTFGDSSSEDDFTGMDPSIMAEFFARNLGSSMQEQNYCYSGDESD